MMYDMSKELDELETLGIKISDLPVRIYCGTDAGNRSDQNTVLRILAKARASKAHTKTLEKEHQYQHMMRRQGRIVATNIYDDDDEPTTHYL